MKNRLYLIFILFSTISCTSQEHLKEYYYQISDKIETKIYKYVDKNDPNKIEYWKVTTNPKTKEMNTVSYDSDFNIYNTFDEILTENGAELIQYADYEKNAFGKMVPYIAEVVNKDVFKWNGDQEYSYSVKYRNQYGRFEFLKKRTELGFEKITVNGKEYETIKFKGDYSINAIDQNDSYGFYQYSFYAKDVGMVKYERHIPNKVVELELTELLTEKQFNDLLEKASR
jgi:hypothetical protein